jgi:hypothetical protein
MYNIEICRRCIEYVRQNRQSTKDRTPCNLNNYDEYHVRWNSDNEFTDFPRPGCDKLFEHAVSVNIDTSRGADVDNRRERVDNKD